MLKKVLFLFFSGEGFIIIYSVADRNSFEKILDFKSVITKIHKKEDEEDIPIVLIGNKCDLKRKVSKELKKVKNNFYVIMYFKHFL